ncbi:MAG TPA: DUF1566 domain-containing protein [Myxococcota bacterium]|nr:DUF1566 domain-containing protein [Myxococcota bacterium]HRY92409.1 DUF1566 domain-containing protein [Myxococcota bacterium]HSA22659.1 DUF1566 domain-containing protein [Myxococcota bacterium]
MRRAFPMSLFWLGLLCLGCDGGAGVQDPGDACGLDSGDAGCGQDEPDQDSPDGEDLPTDGDAPPQGAPLTLTARAVERCGSWAPDHQTGLQYQTPTGLRVGLMGVELLRSHLDPAPVALGLPASIVEVDVEAGGALAEARTTDLPAGDYTHVRLTLAYAVYHVLATGHSFAVAAGDLGTDMALSNHQGAGGALRAQGQYTATFVAYGQPYTYSGSTTLNCTLSLWGGKVTTAGGLYQVTVPLPGWPLRIDHASQTPLAVALEFPMQDTFAWQDLDLAGFGAGVYDLVPPPGDGELPDSLLECNLLLADRCQGEAVVPLHPTWSMPDSSPLFFTDGAQVVAECPAPGAPASGQDACYAIAPLDYQAADGVVEDQVTGLAWQQATPVETYDWWEARDYCQALSLGGHDDWRLPSRVELVSLLDLGRIDPTIDPGAFPGTPSDFYWSSSPVPFLGFAYGVRFELGFVYDHDANGGGRVRCVRGGYAPPQPRFAVQGDVVLDQGSGLMWQRRHEEIPVGWLEALALCEGLDLGGFDDWRLPTMKETQTLVDERRLQPAIDIFAFPGTPAEWFWSSTPIATHPDQAWCTSYTDGYASIHAGAELHRVRCVRDP